MNTRKKYLGIAICSLLCMFFYVLPWCIFFKWQNVSIWELSSLMRSVISFADDGGTAGLFMAFIYVGAILSILLLLANAFSAYKKSQAATKDVPYDAKCASGFVCTLIFSLLFSIIIIGIGNDDYSDTRYVSITAWPVFEAILACSGLLILKKMPEENFSKGQTDAKPVAGKPFVASIKPHFSNPSSEKALPVVNYSPSAPYQIVRVLTKQNQPVIALEIVGYNAELPPTAMRVNVQFTTLFNDTIDCANLSFLCIAPHGDLTYRTEYVSIDLAPDRIRELTQARVFISRLADANQTVPTDYTDVRLKLEKLQELRALYGQDVMCDYSSSESAWVCYCGAKNAKSTAKCKRCRRTCSNVNLLNQAMQTSDDWEFMAILKQALEGGAPSFRAKYSEILELRSQTPDVDEFLRKAKLILASWMRTGE